MDRFDPFAKYADVYGDIINWEKDPMNKPRNQNKYFFSDGKTYYEQICKMLRLMSVFKEAFNQIYSNEDEISEAWENFVNNLSASVVEGSEPDVTLTWTDDSVNFEFTMVPGVPGEQGVGITSISFNSDYTMTITLSDGNTYTSMSLKGETGPQGPQGETGSGLQILDVYATLADLQSAHPTGQPGDAYQVGSGGNYILYIWSSSQSAWVQSGTLVTVSPSTSNPLMDGTASAGSSNLYSRGDHVHPSDTSRASKDELDALIKTSQALIDQSFTYKKSPAIQDGLARIDKIKGNTLIWNQLIDPRTASGTMVGVDYSLANGIVTLNGTATGTLALYVDKNQTLQVIKGHKYYLRGCPSGGSGTTYQIFTTSSSAFPIGYRLNDTGNGGIQTAMENEAVIIQVYGYMNTVFNNTKFYPQLFDLTAMGLDSLTDAEILQWFTDYFPLSYYSYNQGSLLSFMGNGIKTVGKNLFDFSQFANGTITFENGILNGTGAQFHSAYGSYATAKKLNCPKGLQITISFDAWTDQNATSTGNGLIIVTYHYDGTHEDAMVPNATGTPRHFTFQRQDIEKIGWSYGTQGANRWHITNFQVEFGTAETSYEPYNESTLSLPVSTYFPTGMKSAESVHDELTDSKAITRTKQVNLWDYSWAKHPTLSNTYYTAYITDCARNVFNGNRWYAYGICNTYPIRQSAFSDNETMIAVYYDTQLNDYRCFITDLNANNVSADDFKTRLQTLNAQLVYAISTPIETAIDLDLSFKSYMNGTEQLLPVNGPAPSTSPIIADMTYLSIDDAMEYVLEKLANVPQNTQQILDALEDDVADLQTDVGALQPAVSGLQTSVGNINTNIGQLSSTVAGHTASISDIQSDISDLNTGLNDLEDTVTDNTSRIGTLETGLSTTNGNVQSLSSQVQSIDGRVTNLESDLFKVVVKEFDYDTVAPETNFGTTTPITQEEGYRVIGVVGTEAQAGEYTSPASNIAITQCHVYYTSLGALTITIFGRNNGASSRTNVRIYAYLLCIKDIQ